MEKNVGSIDLEELKRAREELMQERGLTEEAPASSFEPADDVVDSYQDDTSYDAGEQSSPLDNPNVSRVFERQEPKPVEQPQEDDDIDIDALVNEVFDDAYESQFGESFEKAMAEVDEFEEESNFEAEEVEPVSEEAPAVKVEETPVEEVSENRDFSVYDSFAAFEVNDGAAAAAPVQPIKDEPVEEAPVVHSQPSSWDEINTKLESVNEQLQETWLDNSYADLELNTEAESTEEPAVEEPANEAVDYSASEVQEPEAEEQPVEEFASLGGLDAFEVEQEEPETEEQLTEEEVEDMAFASLSGLGSFDFDAGQKSEDPAVEEVEETKEADVVVENANEDVAIDGTSMEGTIAETEEESMSMISSLHDLEMMMKEDEERVAKLDEEIEKLEQQVETGEILEEDEESETAKPKTSSVYKTIEPYKFVDVINLDEFKDSDKLTYVLGKDEQGAMHYGNLRDNYNLVVFGKENEHTNNLVHSVLLSLILKNTVNEVNFVICDSKADSKFEVYNKSSYMYFNRIAKTNKEILDILIELNKELEERYKLLAEIGVKSIEQYNIIAKNDNLKPLPYIVTVFNNYSKAIQLTESDKINTCLYQILKFGRIAGLYIILTANNAIMSNEINYNLPTRISFKCADSAMSLTTLGEDGAENLAADGDFLYSTIGAEKLSHVKGAMLTSNEIELLIENIED